FQVKYIIFSNTIFNSTGTSGIFSYITSYGTTTLTTWVWRIKKSFFLSCFPEYLSNYRRLNSCLKIFFIYVNLIKALHRKPDPLKNPKRTATKTCTPANRHYRDTILVCQFHYSSHLLGTAWLKHNRGRKNIILGFIMSVM